MQPHQSRLFVLGASGFVGKALVREALSRGFEVTALVRSSGKGQGLAALGAKIVDGDATDPQRWIAGASGHDVIVDLLQPELPRRISRRAIEEVAARRLAMTQALIRALRSLDAARRPLLLSVSGLDDLARDEQGRVRDGSALAVERTGFSRIGIPVRQEIEASGIACAFAYLGTVYGPGKTFATTVFPQLAEGRFRIPGKGRNRMALVHVDDAARALAHVSALGRDGLANRSFIIADGHPPTMSEFFAFAADYMGAPRPRFAPLWLVRAFAGSALAETMTRDIFADPKDLIETRFTFRYPAYRDGLPPSIDQLGYQRGGSARKSAGSRAFWLLAAVTLVALLAENLLYFPLSVPWMKHLAGGAPTLDMRPGYSPEAAYQLFDTLGQAGRATYLKLLWTVDLILPTLFGLFLSSAIRRGGLRAWRRVPWIGTACDYAENIAITVLLLRYPGHEPGLVQLASALTVVKLAGYCAGTLTAVAGAFYRRKTAHGHVGTQLLPHT
jgi:nucleoside-diphosphate-sugar epimerase